MGQQAQLPLFHQAAGAHDGTSIGIANLAWDAEIWSNLPLDCTIGVTFPSTGRLLDILRSRVCLNSSENNPNLVNLSSYIRPAIPRISL
eukprot:g25712.t1